MGSYCDQFTDFSARGLLAPAFGLCKSILCLLLGLMQLCIFWSAHHCLSPGSDSPGLNLSVLLQHAVLAILGQKRQIWLCSVPCPRVCPTCDGSAAQLLKIWLLPLNPRCLVWGFFVAFSSLYDPLSCRSCSMDILSHGKCRVQAGLQGVSRTAGP